MTVGYRAGWIGEAQVSYGGPGPSSGRGWPGRSCWIGWSTWATRPIETRAEVVGVDSLYPGAASPAPRAEPSRSAARVAVRTHTQEEAEMAVHEMDSLGLNGPPAAASRP